MKTETSKDEKVMQLNETLPEFYLENLEERLETDPLTVGSLFLEQNLLVKDVLAIVIVALMEIVVINIHVLGTGNDKPQVNCLFNRVVPEISPVQFFCVKNNSGKKLIVTFII